jgi:dTDP-4-amino-4,6-dideoxygalactose transaminase
MPRSSLLPFSLPTLGPEEIDEAVSVLRSGWITTGALAARFEQAISERLGGGTTLAVSSGTAALHLSLLALNLKKGDEVICPSLTWPATANTIVLAGGKPVFADVRPDDLNIDLEDVARRVTRRTRAIVPVHFAGAPCDMKELLAIARRKRLTVIQDAAHAIGTRYGGREVGGWGHVACYSFHPTKDVTTAEGGAIWTQNKRIADAARLHRFHGVRTSAWERVRGGGKRARGYDVALPGLKYNLTDLHAALGVHQLSKLEGFIAARTRLAEAYAKRLSAFDLVEIPEARLGPGDRHAWHIFPVLLRTERLAIDRFEVMERLKRENIGTGLHFLPVHLTRYYRKVLGARRGDLPVTERAGARILSLPLFPRMTGQDVEDAVAALEKVLGSAARRGGSRRRS